jgi:penicillin-binding protein 2
MDPEVLEDWARKMRGLMVLAGLLFAILLLRLFHLQITTADNYAKESEDNWIAQKRRKAPRGLVLDRDGEVLARNRAAYSIQLTRGSREDDAKAIEALESATGESVRLGKRGRERTVRLKRDVKFRTVAIVEERLRDEWPLGIAIEPQRLYPAGALAAHIIGYMGEQQDDLTSHQGRPYAVGDYVGQTGLERVYEDSLRGWDGVDYVEVDVRDRVINEHPFPDRGVPPRSGRDLHLTVDLDIQRAATNAMPDSLAGSVVALDARDGAVLAMVSHPSYDPNVFVSYGSQAERQRLIQDPAKPMLNRAIQGGYPPGSTLKMIGAVAALENGVTDTLSTFAACAGSLQVGDVVFRCANRDGHGELNLLEAVETSCNIYFNHLAKILGIEAWHDYGSRFGFGLPTHIDLDPSEFHGILPDRQYHRERDGWVTGHLMNLVIGQGYMLVTPLQMARYVAALGNGGYLVTPHLQGKAPDPVRIEGITDATLDIVRRAMYRVVYGEHGTGKRAQVPGIEVAGKSGTAQGPRADDDAWFVAFAPFEEPEIAVAVVVEGGGGGGSNAAPIARAVIKAYFDDQAQRQAVAADSPNNKRRGI